MTKQEFLDHLVDGTYPIIAAKDVEIYIHDISPQDKLYSVNVRKILGNKINFENISFVVVKEGTPNESAYFYQRNTIAFDNKQENGEITETE